jgi:tetratricopeptide (TPR) repeat protein
VASSRPHLKLRDPDAAEPWYRRSLELRSWGDNLGKAICFRKLGQVAFERFELAQQGDRPLEGSQVHLRTAADHCRQALDLLPDTAVGELCGAHHQLGSIYARAGEVNRALHHYQQSIRYAEASGDLYSAGGSRHDVALMLLGARLPDARADAEAALANMRGFGDQAAADKLQQIASLLADIDARIAKGSQP